jgi:hypothetical protein
MCSALDCSKQQAMEEFLPSCATYLQGLGAAEAADDYCFGSCQQAAMLQHDPAAKHPPCLVVDIQRLWCSVLL